MRKLENRLGLGDAGAAGPHVSVARESEFILGYIYMNNYFLLHLFIIACSTSRDAETLRSFEEAAKALRPAIFLVDVGGKEYGTAFVISRRQRLLATAGHAGDGILRAGPGKSFAIGNQARYPVEKVYLHPATYREIDDGCIVRSDDPRDGPIDGWLHPDMAVLRLGPGGPELPAEVALADTAELNSLKNKVVAGLGFLVPPTIGPNQGCPPAS